MKTLDLTKMNGMGPISISEMKGPAGPTVHLEGDKPYELPENGTATVRFRIRRTSHDVENGRYEVCLELLSLKDIKGTGAVVGKPDTSTSDALDEIRNSMLAENTGENEEED